MFLTLCQLVSSINCSFISTNSLPAFTRSFMALVSIKSSVQIISPQDDHGSQVFSSATGQVTWIEITSRCVHTSLYQPKREVQLQRTLPDTKQLPRSRPQIEDFKSRISNVAAAPGRRPSLADINPDLYFQGPRSHPVGSQPPGMLRTSSSSPLSRDHEMEHKTDFAMPDEQERKPDMAALPLPLLQPSLDRRHTGNNSHNNNSNNNACKSSLSLAQPLPLPPPLLPLPPPPPLRPPPPIPQHPSLAPYLTPAG